MEETRKRPGYDPAGDVAGKQARTERQCEDVDQDNNEEEDLISWFSIDGDETAAELSKLLDAGTTSQPFRVKFIDDPYSSTLVFQSSALHITINGNEESCGSSFSDMESSVMVSVDTGGFRGLTGAFSEAEGSAWSSDAEEARGWLKEDSEGCLADQMNGQDGSDEYDDDMLAKFLGEDLFG